MSWSIDLSGYDRNSAKRAEHRYGRSTVDDNGKYFTRNPALDWWLGPRRFGDPLMATAHSPVPDSLFLIAMAGVAGAMAGVGWLLPHVVTSALLGILGAVVAGRWLTAPFHRFLGKFNIET